jgi:hypothetical protein
MNRRKSRSLTAVPAKTRERVRGDKGYGQRAGIPPAKRTRKNRGSDLLQFIETPSQDARYRSIRIARSCSRNDWKVENGN